MLSEDIAADVITYNSLMSVLQHLNGLWLYVSFVN